MIPPFRSSIVAAIFFVAAFIALACASVAVKAQDTVTGAFEGTVTNNQTSEPISGALIEIINEQTNFIITKRADARGRFYQGLLNPGIYLIRVSASGFTPREVRQRLFITRTGEVVPIPVSLDPAPSITATPTPQAAGATPTATPPSVAPTPAPPSVNADDLDVRAKINTSNASHDGSFTEEDVMSLPLGAITLVRTFDELALLLPGVALPPQTSGTVAGPGVGSGVGTSGQFAVNGLRSRANNFTVDGSDNNDEDIGVRRQGFVALNSQPIESVKEYQAITLLAPAQFGRNIGAQVNAVSKSGGNQTHGVVYGLFNSSQLNARDAFEGGNPPAASQLRAQNNQQAFLFDTSFNARPLAVIYPGGRKDSFTLGQGGFAVGGALSPDKMFYFISAEGQTINAARKANFIVPTIEQRGFLGTGATGISTDPMTGKPVDVLPSNFDGAAVFSLFPFPNNPDGVYGPNTFTESLPASGRGEIYSGKFDGNFRAYGRAQSVTARYNFTDDWRDIPYTGGALFSTIRPRVRTQNFSFFLNSELSGAASSAPMFNQIRLSYGRTRLRFEEVRDNTYSIPSDNFPDTPFLLNAPLRFNFSHSGTPGVPYNGPVGYLDLGATTESVIGPVGQIKVAGFSPLGVDVFNFPQRRVNNTYQFADTLTARRGFHALTFGFDIRRTELNSDLQRNSRPLITFSGAPEIRVPPDLSSFTPTGGYYDPTDLVAAGAASGILLTLSKDNDTSVGLRYYQYDFFGRDEWRVRPNLSLSYGLRYEYNTPPVELNRRIEKTFNDPALDLVPGLRYYLDGRKRIFDPDRNNFAPRVSLAYSPDIFGRDRLTVVRAGYGIFYDQILGAVVSQSRNVFPSFLTVNLAGGLGNVLFTNGGSFSLFNPSDPQVIAALRDPALAQLFPGFTGLVKPGTLSTLIPGSLAAQVSFLNFLSSIGGAGLESNEFSTSGAGITLPARHLPTPTAQHYTLTVDQQLGRNTVLSVAYVGTKANHLLRFTTPNLGENAFIVVNGFQGAPVNGIGTLPSLNGFALPPLRGEKDSRPVSGVGAVNLFETTANSRYDALQVQLRGRFLRSFQYQIAYGFSKSLDDVSDVFDLAGAYALPQDSYNLRAERAPSNFDARHRFSYNFIYDLPSFKNRSAPLRLIFDNLQIAGTGQYQTGQPFTVNSSIDVNLDGNLTDRLNTTQGIIVTGDPRQPLRLSVSDPTDLLAPLGENGQVGRNTFRAGGLLLLNLAITKRFVVASEQSVIARMEIFNLTNRANYGIPDRILESPGFGKAADTVTPGRRIQFSLKYSF